MPKRGQYVSQCAYGHDLTQPGSRIPPGKGKRGLGGCRQCTNERSRVKRGSFKTGPVNRFRVNDERREQAVSDGLRWCTVCEQGKSVAAFNKDASSPDGLSKWCRPCRKAKRAEAYQRDRERLLLMTQARTFKVKPEALLAMREQQDNRCAICRQACVTGRALAVDHDHGTGQIRALLCANCNRALGLLQDSPQIAASAHAYLLYWKASPDASRVEGVQQAGLS